MQHQLPDSEIFHEIQYRGPKPANERQSRMAPTSDIQQARRDPLAHVECRSRDASCAAVHRVMLNRITEGEPARAQQSLVRLQREYGNRYVQRAVGLVRQTESEMEVDPQLEDAIQSVRGTGQPLESLLRQQLELAFGADFGGVRVHSDPKADGLNRAVQSRAFATGQDIFSREGEYNPGTVSGRELLVHELTHVMQQRGGQIRSKLVINAPGDEYEREADRVVRAMAAVPFLGAKHRNVCNSDAGPAGECADRGAKRLGPRADFTPRLERVIAPPIQERRCACGGIVGPDGECAACRARRLGRLDKKPAPNELVSTLVPIQARSHASGSVGGSNEECPKCRKTPLGALTSTQVVKIQSHLAPGRVISVPRTEERPGEADRPEVMGGIVATFALPCYGRGGLSHCNPDTGNYDIDYNDNSCCTRNCTQLHEERHVSDLSDCCMALAAAIRGGGDRSALIGQYNDWMRRDGALAWTECNAYGVSVECGRGMYASEQCDRASSQRCAEIEDYIKLAETHLSHWCGRAPTGRPRCPFGAAAAGASSPAAAPAAASSPAAETCDFRICYLPLQTLMDMGVDPELAYLAAHHVFIRWDGQAYGFTRLPGESISDARVMPEPRAGKEPFERCVRARFRTVPTPTLGQMIHFSPLDTVGDLISYGIDVVHGIQHCLHPGCGLARHRITRMLTDDRKGLYDLFDENCETWARNVLAAACLEAPEIRLGGLGNIVLRVLNETTIGRLYHGVRRITGATRPLPAP